jgi:hypothetical protein
MEFILAKNRNQGTYDHSQKPVNGYLGKKQGEIIPKKNYFPI